REVNLPAQPVVDGQLRGCAESVLAIEEPALLPLCGIIRGGKIRVVHITGERSHVAQKESCQIQSACSSIGRALWTEVELSGSVVVAGNSQIHRVPDICSPLDDVV